MLFASGMVAVPCRDYPSSQHSIITSLDAFLKTANSCGQFFLLHETYTSCPLEIRQIIANGGRKFYYIMPRNGGPTIDLNWSVNGARLIRKGSLSHYPSYWNTLKKANMKPPEPLIQAYRKLASFIKTKSQKIVAPKSKRTFYLGTDAKRLRDGGVSLVGWDDVPSLVS